MKDKCIIALKRAEVVPEENADYIGADRGALVLADQGIRMVLAVGDFDSVTAEELERIKAYADEVVVLNCIKDDSDSEHAVREAVSRGYTDIVLYGALGGRLDHEYVNLQLAVQFAGVLTLADSRNRIKAYKKGSWRFPAGKSKYFSVFACEPSCISLQGMKYGLDHRELKPEDLYGLSNEITGEEGILTVHAGTVLVFLSED